MSTVAKLWTLERGMLVCFNATSIALIMLYAGESLRAPNPTTIRFGFNTVTGFLNSTIGTGVSVIMIAAS
jgi:hypothetical protein